MRSCTAAKEAPAALTFEKAQARSTCRSVAFEEASAAVTTQGFAIAPYCTRLQNCVVRAVFTVIVVGVFCERRVFWNPEKAARVAALSVGKNSKTTVSAVTPIFSLSFAGYACPFFLVGTCEFQTSNSTTFLVFAERGMPLAKENANNALSAIPIFAFRGVLSFVLPFLQSSPQQQNSTVKNKGRNIRISQHVPLCNTPLQGFHSWFVTAACVHQVSRYYHTAVLLTAVLL